MLWELHNVSSALIANIAFLLCWVFSSLVNAFYFMRGFVAGDNCSPEIRHSLKIPINSSHLVKNNHECKSSTGVHYNSRYNPTTNITHRYKQWSFGLWNTQIIHNGTIVYTPLFSHTNIYVSTDSLYICYILNTFNPSYTVSLALFLPMIKQTIMEICSY